MATPLIIGAALAGLLPLGALAGRNNQQIMEKINMLPKRQQQISRITDLWKSSLTDEDNYEESEIILDNFINLCLTVISNNESKNNEHINIELLQTLKNSMNTTFKDIPSNFLLIDNREDTIININNKLDALIDNYTKYIFNKNKKNSLIDTLSDNEIYNYVLELLKLNFNILIRSTTTAEISKSELMIEEKSKDKIENIYKNIETIYIEQSNTLLSTVYYSIDKLSDNDEYKSKVITLKNKIIELEKTYRDDLAKQAISLYPYYFDNNRNEKTKIGEYLDVLNIKINGINSLSTLDNLSSVLDQNNNLEEDNKKIYLKSFNNFINFVKKDLRDINKEKKREIIMIEREKELEKKRKKKISNEDDDLLLLMLLIEDEY